MKSRRRESRLARVQDFMAQQRHRFPKARSQEADQPLQSMWGGPGGLLRTGPKSPRVLTYHEIPLLTLDWTGAKACMWGGAQADDLWAGRTSGPGEAAVDRRGGPSSPGNLSSVTGKASDAAASVCDVWQAFVTGPTSGDHSGLFESEWLQTATSVFPSDDPRAASSRGRAPDTSSCQLPGLALNRAGGTRASRPGDDRSKHASKCPADRSDESHKIMREQAPGGRVERMGEESFTPPTADSEPGGWQGSKSTERPRITGRISRKDGSLFSRPGETRTDEICPSRAGRLKQSPVQSEGSGNAKAASGNLEALKAAGVETCDSTSQEPGRLTGDGLGIIRQWDGEQQQAGKDLQIHRGEHNGVPEPAQKPEEEEQEEEKEVTGGQEEQEDSEMTQMEEDVGFGEQGSVLTRDDGQGPASGGRKKELKDNSGTHTSQTGESRASQNVSQDNGETVRPLPNEESTADVEETRWLLAQDAMESQEEDESNNTIKETDIQRPETSGRMEGDMNPREEIEEQGELRDDAGVPQGEKENPAKRVEAGEKSGEAESSSSAECEGTPDMDALRVMESGLKKATIRKFGEDLVWAIWEEVFKTPKNDFNADGRADAMDAVPRQEDFGSGVNSSTVLHPHLRQCLPQDRRQTLTSTGQAHSALSGPSAEQEACPQMAEEQDAAPQDSCNPTEAPSCEELKESPSLLWWRVFYVLSHITRLTVFSGVIVGLFLYFVLCDFPAFFAVYMFSLCFWFYKWKRRQVAKVEGMEGWHGPCVQTGEML